MRRQWLVWTLDGYRELTRLHQPVHGERAIVEKVSGEFVGLVGLVPSLVAMGQLTGFGERLGAPQSPEFGLFWAVLPAVQRRGYAAEAARAFMVKMADLLQAGRVVATTEHENAASLRVMQKIGMRVERNPHPDPFYLQAVGVWERPG